MGQGRRPSARDGGERGSAARNLLRRGDQGLSEGQEAGCGEGLAGGARQAALFRKRQESVVVGFAIAIDVVARVAVTDALVVRARSLLLKQIQLTAR